MLEAEGWSRDEVQLAWDFTTASGPDHWGDLVHMRDDAFAQVGGQVNYVIDSVTENYSEHIARRIRGKIEVPLYLDTPGVGGFMVRDDQGMPVAMETAEYPFTILVPYSALENPAPTMAIGHGLFGDQSQINGFQEFANEANIILFALDWIGMSNVDPTYIGLILQNGQFQNFVSVPDRLCQAQVNFLLATNMMRTTIVDDPAFDDGNGGSVIDPTTSYYYGGSQGGILGAVYMALTKEVQRGVLAVPGQPYNLLLDRSVLYGPFQDVIYNTYETKFDAQMLLHLAQTLWDRGEPSGFSRHVVNDRLPDTPEHEVLLLLAKGDHQVNNLGGHVMARSIGAKSIAPAIRPIWGIEEVEQPYMGPASMVEYDFGLPDDPIVNQPQTTDPDPHGAIAGVPSAFVMSAQFLSTGVVETGCTDVCDPD